MNIHLNPCSTPKVFFKFLSKLLWLFKFQLINPLFDVYLIFFLHIEGPSLAEDLALAWDLALTQVYARPLSSEQKRGGLFLGIFVYSLTFSQNFFCSNFVLKFPMSTHVPTHSTHKTQTVHTYCTHNTHLPTRLTTLARTLESSNNKQAKKKDPKKSLCSNT